MGVQVPGHLNVMESLGDCFCIHLLALGRPVSSRHAHSVTSVSWYSQHISLAEWVFVLNHFPPGDTHWQSHPSVNKYSWSNSYTGVLAPGTRNLVNWRPCSTGFSSLLSGSSGSARLPALSGLSPATGTCGGRPRLGGGGSGGAPECGHWDAAARRHTKEAAGRRGGAGRGRGRQEGAGAALAAIKPLPPRPASLRCRAAGLLGLCSVCRRRRL